MLNTTANEDSHCGCNSQTGYSENGPENFGTIDPRVSETIRQLDSYSQRLGGQMTRAITAGAQGQGPLAGEFSSVGNGSEAVFGSLPGDVIIARGLFSDSDPRVEVVGFDPNYSHASLVESFDDEGQIEVYRPAQQFGENPAALRGALAVAGGKGGGGGSSPLGVVNDVLKGLNSLADLRLKHHQIRKNDRDERQPKLDSPTMSLMSETYRSPNEKTSVYRFNVIGKRRGTFYDSADYRPAFDVSVRHDCINILDARVVCKTKEALGSTLPYEMSVKITDSKPSPHLLPALLSMNIEVEWNPDRGSDLFGGSNESYKASALLEIYASGKVGISSLIRSPEVSITAARPIKRSIANCKQLYAQIDRHIKRGQVSPNVAPFTPAPQPGFRGGVTKAPRTRSVIPGPSTAVRPHPVHGRHIFFGFRSANPDGYAFQEVRNWWNGLPNAIKASIVSGQRTLYVTGHADYTGRDRFNLSLSERRAQRIADMIRKVANQSLPMRVQGMGWRSARDAGQRPGQRNQNWRRVTMSLDNPG